MEQEQLHDIELAMQLLPKRILDPDAYVLANFEWLFARFADEQRLFRWWRVYRDLIHSDQELSSSARTRVAERLPHQAGGFEWLEIPTLVLTAACHIIEETSEMPHAQQALIEGLAFAPHLIEQDLILALVLHLQLEGQHAEPA
jgi:hypothetical protein